MVNNYRQKYLGNLSSLMSPFNANTSHLVHNWTLCFLFHLLLLFFWRILLSGMFFRQINPLLCSSQIILLFTSFLLFNCLPVVLFLFLLAHLLVFPNTVYQVLILSLLVGAFLLVYLICCSVKGLLHSFHIFFFYQWWAKAI